MSYVDSKRRTFQAGSDLTNFQYMIGKLNASGQVIPSTASTDKHVCIIEDNVPSLDYGAMRVIGGDGTYNVIAGGTIAIGDKLTSNSSSQAVTTTTSGDELIGQALHAAVSGDLVEFIPFRGKF